jgi:hypothetical protein
MERLNVHKLERFELQDKQIINVGLRNGEEERFEPKESELIELPKNARLISRFSEVGSVYTTHHSTTICLNGQDYNVSIIIKTDAENDNFQYWITCVSPIEIKLFIKETVTLSNTKKFEYASSVESRPIVVKKSKNPAQGWKVILPFGHQANLLVRAVSESTTQPQDQELKS